MTKANPFNWESEFKQFLEADTNPVPAALSENVLAAVKTQLHPTFWQVLAKLAVIQAVAGAASLAFCPQFGISFTGNHGLMHYLMQYGENVCMVGCGALFTGLSLLVASLALRPEEVRTLRKHRLLQVTTIAALSLAAFACSGAEIIAGYGLVWTLGAIVGGLATLELGWSVRRFSYGRRRTV